MALTAAAGAIAKPQDTFKTTLADCSNFQSWCGAASQAEALARIYEGSILAPGGGDSYALGELQTKRPFAILFTEPEGGFTKRIDAVGVSYQFRSSGNMVAYLEQDSPEGVSDSAEVERRVQNSIGQIIDDLCSLAGTPGYLAITEITAYGPYRSTEEEAPAQGDFLSYYLDVQWGQQ